MPATQIATVHTEGLHTNTVAGGFAVGTFSLRDLTGNLIGSSGHVSPNLKTLRIRHVGEIKRIKGQKGLTTGLLANDEMLECSFDWILEGTSRADSLKSGRLPLLLSAVDIANLPVIICGGFTDALNNTGLTGKPWIYEGDGSVNGESEDVWTGSFTLRRYEGITTWSIVS